MARQIKSQKDRYPSLEDLEKRI